MLIVGFFDHIIMLDTCESLKTSLDLYHHLRLCFWDTLIF